MKKPLEITPIPAFNDNYLWLITQQPDKAIVIDPGDAVPVLDYLSQHALTLEAILITHHHGDHIGGINSLLKQYPVPVYGPRSDKIPQITAVVSESSEIQLFPSGSGEATLILTVFDVPGHTRDHVAYLGKINGKTSLFCGDTLFAAGCGRLFDGTPKQLCHSLQKINQLPENTLIYCTHEYTMANLVFAQQVEPNNAAIDKRIATEQRKRSQNQPTLPSTLGLERQTNPFLRYQQPEVARAINDYWQANWTTDEDLFAGLRRWKDVY